MDNYSKSRDLWNDKKSVPDYFFHQLYKFHLFTSVNLFSQCFRLPNHRTSNGKNSALWLGNDTHP